MVDLNKLDEVDWLAARYQPPVRKVNSEDYYMLDRDLDEDGVVLVCGSSMTPQPIAWIWKFWLAQGKLHVLAGAPGQGKTTLALSFMATISCGGSWPDNSCSNEGNVLIWSGEDDPSDTLLPRLMAMGANQERIFFVEATRIAGEIVTFDPARHMDQLFAAIERIGGISLLVVDPIVSAVAGDSHKNAEVRRGLQPLVDLAARCNCALLGISHFSKGGQGQDPTQRVVGSIAFAAVPRVVMVAAKVASSDGTERRMLVRSKSNVGPDDGGFEYSIEQTEPRPGIHASCITWGEAVDGTAQELLADSTGRDVNAQDEDHDGAMDMLRSELTADRWTNSNLASKPLEDAGYSKKAIWKATKKLGVIRHKSGFGKTLAVHWRLPGSGTVPFIDASLAPALDLMPTNSQIDSIHSGVENKESMESMLTAKPLEAVVLADVEVF